MAGVIPASRVDIPISSRFIGISRDKTHPYGNVELALAFGHRDFEV
jgi:hypothetical protein